MKAQKILTKKELKDEAIDKIESGLTYLKDRLGEKKFHKRVRKAAKLLTNGLPKNAVRKSDITE